MALDEGLCLDARCGGGEGVRPCSLRLDGVELFKNQSVGATCVNGYLRRLLEGLVSRVTGQAADNVLSERWIERHLHAWVSPDRLTLSEASWDLELRKVACGLNLHYKCLKYYFSVLMPSATSPSAPCWNQANSQIDFP